MSDSKKILKRPSPLKGVQIQELPSQESVDGNSLTKVKVKPLDERANHEDFKLLKQELAMKEETSDYNFNDAFLHATMQAQKRRVTLQGVPDSRDLLEEQAATPNTSLFRTRQTLQAGVPQPIQATAPGKEIARPTPSRKFSQSSQLSQISQMSLRKLKRPSYFRGGQVQVAGVGGGDMQHPGSPGLPPGFDASSQRPLESRLGGYLNDPQELSSTLSHSRRNLLRGDSHSPNAAVRKMVVGHGSESAHHQVSPYLRDNTTSPAYESIHAGFINGLMDPAAEEQQQQHHGIDSMTEEFIKKKLAAEIKLHIQNQSMKVEDENPSELTRVSYKDRFLTIKAKLRQKLSQFFSKPSDLESPTPQVDLKKIQDDISNGTTEKTPTAATKSPLPQDTTKRQLRRKTILKGGKDEEEQIDEKKRKDQIYAQIQKKLDKIKSRLDKRTRNIEAMGNLHDDEDENEEEDILKQIELQSEGVNYKSEKDANVSDTFSQKTIRGSDKIKKIVILQPNSRPRHIMNWVVLILASFDCLYIPVDIAFSQGQESQSRFETSAGKLRLAIHAFINIAYIVDMIIKFFTGYVDPVTREDVTDVKKIGKRYVQSWEFILDFISALPVVWLFQGERYKVLQILLMSKVFNIQLPDTFKNQRIEQKLVFRLMNVLISLMLYIHVSTCFIYWLATFDAKWLPSQYDFYGIQDDFYKKPIFDQYSIMFYHAVMILSGNEINPIGNLNIMIVSILYITGSLVTANIFANVTVIISNINSRTQKLQENLNLANTTMSNMILPENLRDDIREFLVTTQNNLDNQNELDHFMQMISPSLRNRVTKHIFIKAIQSNPILRGSQELINFLLNEVTTLLYLPEDKIVCQGQKGDSLYLIAKGNCSVWVTTHMRKEVFVRQIFQGEFFGEISVIRKTLRTATVKSSNYCTMACLNKTIFFDLCGIFPEIIIKMKLKSMEYKDTMKRFKLLLVKQISYFDNAPDKDHLLDEIQFGLQEEYFPKGSILVNQNDECQSILFVVTGKLELLLKNEDGEDFLFEILSQGACVGQCWVLFHETVKFTIKAHTDCRVLILNSSFFIENRETIHGLEDAVVKAEDIIDQFGMPIMDVKVLRAGDTPVKKFQRAIRRIVRLNAFGKKNGNFEMIKYIQDLSLQREKLEKKNKKVSSSKDLFNNTDFIREARRPASKTFKMKRLGENGSGLQITKGLLSAKKRRRSILNQDAFNQAVDQQNPLKKQATIVKEETEQASSSSHLSCSEAGTNKDKGEEKELANTQKLIIEQQQKLIEQLTSNMMSIRNEIRRSREQVKHSARIMRRSEKSSDSSSSRGGGSSGVARTSKSKSREDTEPQFKFTKVKKNFIFKQRRQSNLSIGQQMQELRNNNKKSTFSTSSGSRRDASYFSIAQRKEGGGPRREESISSVTESDQSSSVSSSTYDINNGKDSSHGEGSSPHEKLNIISEKSELDSKSVSKKDLFTDVSPPAGGPPAHKYDERMLFRKSHEKSNSSADYHTPDLQRASQVLSDKITSPIPPGAKKDHSKSIKKTSKLTLGEYQAYASSSDEEGPKRRTPQNPRLRPVPQPSFGNPPTRNLPGRQQVRKEDAFLQLRQPSVSPSRSRVVAGQRGNLPEVVAEPMISSSPELDSKQNTTAAPTFEKQSQSPAPRVFHDDDSSSDDAGYLDKILKMRKEQENSGLAKFARDKQ